VALVQFGSNCKSSFEGDRIVALNRQKLAEISMWFRDSLLLLLLVTFSLLV